MTETTTKAGDRGETGGTGERVRVWLVERTFSDDEQNIVITTYATPDGRRDYRQERALTTFTGTDSGTPVARDVEPGNLGTTTEEERERYAAEAARMADRHDPEDRI
jgi:hypothetical protein